MRTRSFAHASVVASDLGQGSSNPPSVSLLFGSIWDGLLLNLLMYLNKIPLTLLPFPNPSTPHRCFKLCLDCRPQYPLELLSTGEKEEEEEDGGMEEYAERQLVKQEDEEQERRQEGEHGTHSLHLAAWARP